MLACQACVTTPPAAPFAEAAMAHAFPGLPQGLAPRRTATIGELFAASSPNFVAALYAAGQEVVGDGDPTENYFLVVRGLFRAVKFTRDGRRQVFAFYMVGDICGLEPDATHELTVEALTRPRWRSCRRSPPRRSAWRRAPLSWPFIAARAGSDIKSQPNSPRTWWLRRTPRVLRFPTVNSRARRSSRRSVDAVSAPCGRR